jgi:hypothetical protein
MWAKRFIVVVVLGISVFGLGGASEPLPLPGSQSEAATTELTEAQNRTRLREQLELFPRTIPEDVHGQIHRESQRARRAIGIFLVTCLALLFFLVLPLFERDKVIDERPLGPDDTHVHRV